jgi:hypothetical protein
MSGLNLESAAHALPLVMETLPAEEISDQVEAFIARNREAIEVSIRQARAEVAEGKASSRTIADIITKGRS